MDQTIYYYEIALSKLGLDVIPDGYQKQLPKHVKTHISPVDRHEKKLWLSPKMVLHEY